MWNAYETALLYKATRDGTLTFRSNLDKGGKRSEDEITAKVTCSLTDKKTLLILGTSTKSHCFRGVL